jgi:hypothetical protein
VKVKAQKKPLTIEAVQYDGQNFDEVREFVGAEFYSAEPDGSIEIYEYIMGLWQVVPVHSYVIRGTKGEFYACSETVFEENYNVVEEERAADAAI